MYFQGGYAKLMKRRVEKMFESNDNKNPIKKVEFMLVALVAVCLLLGVIVSRSSYQAYASFFWIASGIGAVAWIIWVNKDNKEDE